MQRVLVAIDGSPGADRALEAAAELAKGFGADIIIVNVEQGFLSEDLEEMRRSEKASIEEVLYTVSCEILERAKAKAAQTGIANIRTYAGLGDAVGFILDIVKQEKPDIVVVGKRGRGRLSGLLIGSVSQKLVSLAPCKVLVVP